MFQIVVFQFLQSPDVRIYCDGRSGFVGQAPPELCFHAGTTAPDPHSSSFHLGFATEGGSVLGVLTDFNFLHHFPEEGTIMGSVFTDDSDLGALSHVTAN